MVAWADTEASLKEMNFKSPNVKEKRDAYKAKCFQVKSFAEAWKEIAITLMRVRGQSELAQRRSTLFHMSIPTVKIIEDHLIKLGQSRYDLCRKYSQVWLQESRLDKKGNQTVVRFKEFR